MKKLIYLFLLVLFSGTMLISCGGSSESSNSSYNSADTSLRGISGKWKSNWNSEGVLNSIQVEIGNSGSGRIKYSYSEPSSMGWTTVMDERVNFERDGNILYWQTSHGETGNFQIKNNELYSADGRHFTRDY